MSQARTFIKVQYEYARVLSYGSASKEYHLLSVEMTPCTSNALIRCWGVQKPRINMVAPLHEWHVRDVRDVYDTNGLRNR
jgi:hypothetical protein